MGQTPELRSRLEIAIRSSQQAVAAANIQKANAEMSKETKASTVQVTQPTIKLKTDFSNFN